jgi:hypothetical protein
MPAEFYKKPNLNERMEALEEDGKKYFERID